VTIIGTGFLGADGVTFDGTPGTAFTVVDDTTITVTTPAHAAGPVDVIVTDADGGDSNPLDFEYLADAALAASLAPSSGSEAGGTLVTITGSGFLGATGVTFDGTAGTPFTVVSDTTITVVVPAHAAGLVPVVVLDDAGDSDPLEFEYTSDASVATALDPDTGSEAGGTVVTITGTGFLGATGVTFDGIAGPEFTVVDDTTITVTSPAHAVGTVDVIVLDEIGGDSEPLDFEYTADAADASSLDPDSGSETGGTIVTITGTGFLGATGVTFDGTAGTAFTVVNDTTITVTSPAHEVGTVDVIVLDELGGDADPLDFEYTADAAVASSLNPTSGTEAGGTVVTITGSGFLGATGVSFDGLDGTAFTVVNDTTITVTTPAHAAGTVDVIVEDPTGDSDPLDYEYLADPSVASSLAPSSGPQTGGTLVTITGSGFLGATGVTFDGTAGTPFTVISDTTITVVAPAHAVGPAQVVVLDDAGDSAPLTFEYTAVESVATSLDPTSGSEAGGTVVTITGTGFLGATGVNFDGTPGTEFTVVNDTTITVTSPAHAVGTVDVVVVDDAGNSAPLDFEYIAVGATAASLDPSFGPVAGGTVVTITGSGFLGATGVTFDGTPGTAFIVVSDTTITVTSPAGDMGLADVVVLDPEGDSAPLPFEYDPEPSVATSLTPTSGSEAGGTVVTITGSGFLGATGVTFDGIAGTDFTVVSDTSITVTTPVHAPGDSDVVVVDGNGGDSNALDFEFIADASVASSLDPTSGTENGGTVVTITGSGFLGAIGVTFDGTPGTEFTVVNNTTITVTTPEHVPGEVDVIVLDGTGNSAPLDYEYVDAAAVIEMAMPDEGPETGGTEVTVMGEGFFDVEGIQIHDLMVTDFTVVSNNMLTFITPENEPGPGPLIIMDDAGVSNAFEFMYLPVPATASALTPTEGTESGGTEVTITGTGFYDATAVEFDGTPGTEFTVINGTTLTVVTPAHLAGPVDVVVIDEFGNSEPLTYTYLPEASDAASLDPTSGPDSGGTTVTITGTGFLGSTGVTFGDVPATNFTVVSDTQITVTSPPNSVGTVDVVVLDDAGDSDPLDFEYLAGGATASSIDPPEGTEIGGTIVTITGLGFLGATGVTFGGDAGTDFTVVDDTTITVTTPMHEPGIVDVVVIDDAGDSAPIDYRYLFDNPTADNLTPDEGTESGGTAITIEGTGFYGATGVDFDGIPGTDFTVVDGTTITVVTPAHVAGPVDVIVRDDLDEVDDAGAISIFADAAPLTYVYLAAVSDAAGIDPDSGSEAGGTAVTITGTGFLGSTGVTFDGTLGAEFTVVSDTQITVITPAHTVGTVDVVVIDEVGGNSDPLDFEYIGVASAASSLNPILGPVTGGTPVTIDGTGFLGATGVTFDGLPGTDFEVLSDTMIVVVTPPHAVGLVDVVVRDPAGDSDPLQFEYGARASIVTGLTPTSGTELGGTEVTITGDGFTGAIGVVFDGTAGTSFTVVNDTTITVTTPAHAPGTVDVIVLDAAGDSEPLDFEFLNVASVASSLNPESGPVSGGDPVAITGSGFTSATGVTFDGLPATSFAVVSDTLITVVSPAHAPGVVGVVVVDDAGSSAPLAYTYFAIDAPSVIAAVDPNRAPTVGGTVVTIRGTGFTAATAVTFGGVAGANFTVVNDTTITVTAPPHAAGIVDLVVLDPDGASAPTDFEYYVLGTIDEVSPSTGPSVGGNTVTISGQCFASATQVLFGATPARSFTVNADGTRIQAVAPAGRGTVDITVVGAGECGNAVLADGYGYTGAAVGPVGPTGPSIPGMPATGVEVFGALTFAALLLLAGGLLMLARRRRTTQHTVEVGSSQEHGDRGSN